MPVVFTIHDDRLTIAGGVTWAQTQEATTGPTTVVLQGTSSTPAEASEEIVGGDELGTGDERGCGWKGGTTRRSL